MPIIYDRKEHDVYFNYQRNPVFEEVIERLVGERKFYDRIIGKFTQRRKKKLVNKTKMGLEI